MSTGNSNYNISSIERINFSYITWSARLLLIRDDREVGWTRREVQCRYRTRIIHWGRRGSRGGRRHLSINNRSPIGVEEGDTEDKVAPIECRRPKEEEKRSSDDHEKDVGEGGGGGIGPIKSAAGATGEEPTLLHKCDDRASTRPLP